MRVVPVVGLREEQRVEKQGEGVQGEEEGVEGAEPGLAGLGAVCRWGGLSGAFDEMN